MTIGIIPARMASTRFPNKPLVDIKGKSMIQRTYEQAAKSAVLDQLIVATDHQDIYDKVLSFGGKAMMTATHHNNGTERCAEVATSFDNEDIIINIQGDEPFFEPNSLQILQDCFQNKAIQIATLAKQIDNEDDITNPSVIKVVKSIEMQGLYFSRQAIPFYREADEETYWKHIGIYAFRNKVLQEIVKLSPTPLEEAEKLEQLRWLENGYQIQLGITTHESNSVDTPEDLDALLKQIR